MTLNRAVTLLEAELNKKRSMSLLDEPHRSELLEVAEALRTAVNLTNKVICEVSNENWRQKERDS